VSMLESRAHFSDGAVAQLGERRVRNAEVEGSIPFCSTITFNLRSVASTVAHEAAAEGRRFNRMRLSLGALVRLGLGAREKISYRRVVLAHSPRPAKCAI